MKHLLLIITLILPVIVGDTQLLAGPMQHRRNPFAPLGKITVSKRPKIKEAIDESKIEVSKEIQLKLNGIVWNKDDPMAIINDTVVKIGSEIGGRKVFAISITNVELDYYDKKEVLKIGPKILFDVSDKKPEAKLRSK